MLVDVHSALTALLAGGAGAVVPGASERRAWEQLCIRARDGGLCGLLAERIRADGIPAPSDVLAQLDREAAHVASRNRRMHEDVERLARACEAAGVKIMLLKGAALLHSVYDDPGCRPMSDIDILISPGDTQRFDRVAREAGFDRGQCHVCDDFFPDYYYEREYLARGSNRTRVDLHVRPWRPLRYSRIVPGRALWRRARSVSIGRSRAFTPSPEDMLIHLCCHAAFHGAGRPLWLIDIHRFLARYADFLDWEYVVETLASWRLTHAWRFALVRCESIFGPVLPDPVRERLLRARCGWRDRLALWQAPRDAHGPLARLAVDMACTPGLRFRLAYLHRVLLPDSRHLGELYPARHVGWQACALGVRFQRWLSRAWCRSDTVGTAPPVP